MIKNFYSPEKVYLGRLPHNSDLLEELTRFCIENNIRTGWISVIGAVKDICLGYYNQEKQEYLVLKEDLGENRRMEIANCSGNISIKEGKPFLHLHIVATNKEGKAFGGHLMPGTIIFAGEFMIQSLQGEELCREFDKETGLSLWQE
jgi:uncharacterized protein